MGFFKILTSFSFVLCLSYSIQNFHQKKEKHVPQELSNQQIRYLAGLSNIKHMEDILNNILIPRVVGTPGHEKVREYITNQLNNLGWTVDVDEFKEKTPNFGSLTFRNIVGTLNPDAERFLVLACHYDSKYFPNAEFVGATDSAVPCAMMLYLASVLKKELNKARSKSDVSLKLIFFDGEEAFKDWSQTDSLYGSRHLANKMQRKLYRTENQDIITDIHRIDLLVLLDLIGASRPHFYSFFTPTERWYIRLVNAEQRLAQLNLLDNPMHLSFNRRSSNSFIEDDHIPFLMRRVPVLHLITIPFPKEWHTPADNRDIVDLNTTENINKILRIFVTEYLHLLDSQESEEESNQHNEL